MNPRAFDEPEGKSLKIMHTRSVNKVLKPFINLAMERLNLRRGFTFFPQTRALMEHPSSSSVKINEDIRAHIWWTAHTAANTETAGLMVAHVMVHYVLVVSTVYPRLSGPRLSITSIIRHGKLMIFKL